MSTVPAVSVGALLELRPDTIGLPLTLLAGAGGLDRIINSPYIQKTGLALAGFHEYLQAGRVLIYGESEIRYLESLSPEARTHALAKSFATGVPCLLLTGDLAIPGELLEEAERANTPLLSSPVTTATAIGKLTALLEDQLAEREIVHGVLLDILGLGVLIIGESGIGKSECALDLVVRGHRLVADDAVEIRRRAGSVIIGTCPELTRHHMEVRGIGLINVQDLYGVASTRHSKRVELVVHLERWEPQHEYDRLGLDDLHHDLLGVKIPIIRTPVAPGRHLAILVEVAARNQLLKSRGIHAARALAARLDDRLAVPSTVSAAEISADDEYERGGLL
jgi:HPr kinase/phosphorylase